MDLAENGQKLREPYNTDEPLERIYTRLNKCANYATTAGEPITEGQVIRIAYTPVAEMGQFHEYCRTWRAKSEP